MTTPLHAAAQQALDALERIDAWLKVRSQGTGLMPQEREVVDALRAAMSPKSVSGTSRKVGISDAPQCLNTNDKAMWVTGYNEAVDALAQPQAQPEPVWRGRWAWVPIEPTTAMLIAGSHGQPGEFSALKVWQDMIGPARRDYTAPIDPPKAAQPQAQPEPFGYFYIDDYGLYQQDRTHAPGPGLVPLYEAAPQPPAAEPDAMDAHKANGLAWAVQKWRDEVQHRPLVNVHRRSLDDTWRQVIRYFGGEPAELVGPSHDELRDSQPPIAQPAQAEKSCATCKHQHAEIKPPCIECFKGFIHWEKK